MCRHFGYLGPPVRLAELIFGPPHSLAVQSYAPSDMRGGGSVNVDGFGVGWFGDEAAAGPARRYRRPVPIWQDSAFAELARDTSGAGVLAAVRNATVGMPVAEAACAPFTDGRWLFSMNGLIAGWPDTAVALADSLPRRELLRLEAMTDAALLWAVLRARLAEADDPALALGRLVAQVLAAAPGSRLTTLLTDGRRLHATTVTHALCWRRWNSAVLVASEPFDDDPAWQPIPDGRLVTADRSGLHHEPLTSLPPTDIERADHVHQR